MRARWLVLVGMLVGCAEPLLVCGEGVDLVGEACVGQPPPPPPEPMELSEWLQDPGRCDPAVGEAELDLVGLCVGGACVGDAYAEVVEVLGSPRLCTASYGGPVCEWPGLKVSLEDGPGEEPADEAAVLQVEVSVLADAVDERGLGVGASPACFIEALGRPSKLVFDSERPGIVAAAAEWRDQGIGIRDGAPTGLSGQSDGVIDQVFLQEPW